MGDTSVTQETKLPEATPEERQLQQMSLGMLDAYMTDAGYEMTPTTAYKNPERVADLEAQRDRLQTQIDTAGAQAPTTTGMGAMVPALSTVGLQGQLDEINRQINEEKAQTTTTYEAVLNDVGIQRQRMMKQALDYQEELAPMIMKKVRDFINGDYAITDAQKAEIETSMAAIRDPVFKLLDEVSAEAEKTETKVGEKLNEYTQAIRDTGLSVGAALDAISARVDDTSRGITAGIGEEEKRIGGTGASIKAAIQGVQGEIDKGGTAARTALEQSFAIHTVLAQRGMEDFYKTQRQAMADQAATLGRSPMDPQFQTELQNQMLRKMETVGLEMAEREALGRAGLEERIGAQKAEAARLGVAEAERTGGAMEAAARERTGEAERTGAAKEALAAEEASLAERLGLRLEDVARLRAEQTQRTGGIREQIAGQKATTEAGLQETGQNLRWQMGLGIPAQAVGLGMDVGQYQSAVRAQELATTGAAMQAGLPQQQMMLQERMAQPTTTQTTSGSPFGAFLGFLGAGAGAAGSVMGGVGSMGASTALRTMAG